MVILAGAVVGLSSGVWRGLEDNNSFCTSTSSCCRFQRAEGNGTNLVGANLETKIVHHSLSAFPSNVRDPKRSPILTLRFCHIY